jgi:hypothetical protein
VSKRNPNIRIHCHPLTFIEQPERIRAAQRGELMHHALGLLGRAAGFGARGAEAAPDEREIERAVFRAFALLDLDAGSWKIQEDFVRPLAAAFALPEFKTWFDPGVTALEEAEIMDAGGDVYRPDRVVFRESGIDVIDFKVGRREDSHREQVANYVDLLGAIFEGKKVAGHLVYIDEPAVVGLG